MQIFVLGDGQLVGPLTQLSRRAGHTVVRIHERASVSMSCELAELIIVAGDRVAIASVLKGVAPTLRRDVIAIDATVPVVEERGNAPPLSEAEWAALLPGARVVRAFGSVPAEAFEAIVGRPGDPSDLAVPLTGDDVDAKARVCEFMRQLGVDPFDLGPSTVSYVMDPQGPLYGKAVSEVEMRELVGWLSGDG